MLTHLGKHTRHNDGRLLSQADTHLPAPSYFELGEASQPACWPSP